MIFGETKVAKGQFHGAKKRVKIWDIVISISFEMKNNCKCLIGYWDDFLRSLVLILPKISGYVRSHNSSQQCRMKSMTKKKQNVMLRGLHKKFILNCFLHLVVMTKEIY